jgi:D-amino-acid oxidase
VSPDSVPDATICGRIMKRGVEICRDLSPLGACRDGLHSVHRQVGYRPYRRGGPRVEVENVERSDGKGAVPVIHNYGAGGTGYMLSYGLADEVLGLLRSLHQS